MNEKGEVPQCSGGPLGLLSPKERELVATIFLEDLTWNELPLNKEARVRIVTALEALTTLGPEQGIVFSAKYLWSSE